MKDQVKSYAFNLLIATSQFFNTLTGGMPDETFSARMWRLELDENWFGKLVRPCIDWFFRTFFNDIDHCFESYLSEVKRNQLPKKYSE